MKPIHSKVIDDKRIEVNGVVFYTQSHTEAVRKYLRQKGEQVSDIERLEQELKAAEEERNNAKNMFETKQAKVIDIRRSISKHKVALKENNKKAKLDKIRADYPIDGLLKIENTEKAAAYIISKIKDRVPSYLIENYFSIDAANKAIHDYVDSEMNIKKRVASIESVRVAVTIANGRIKKKPYRKIYEELGMDFNTSIYSAEKSLYNKIIVGLWNIRREHRQREKLNKVLTYAII